MTQRNVLNTAARPRRYRAALGFAAALATLGAALAGPALAQQPRFVPPPAQAPDVRPGEACSLVLVQSLGSRQLIARAAPGVTGRWSLRARGSGLDVDLGGGVPGSPRIQELSRVTLDAQLRPAVDHSAAGLYGPVSSPGQTPVNATLIVRDERGRVICRARPELR